MNYQQLQRATYMHYTSTTSHNTVFTNTTTTRGMTMYLSIIRIKQCIYKYHCHVDKEIFKQCPHMRTGVDLLHLDLSVNIAVIKEVDIRHLYLFINNSEQDVNSIPKSRCLGNFF